MTDVYCDECRSYHPVPRDGAHWKELRCRAPWESWEGADDQAELGGNRTMQAVRAAVWRERRFLLAFLGAGEGESLHEVILRKQAESNLLREAAVVEEREACAKVCEVMPHCDPHGWPLDHADYAAAIRARGQ